MTSAASVTNEVRAPQAVVWLRGFVFVYAIARICQAFADRLPIILIVVLHVAPPALFALVHGAMVYGRRGIAVFAAICLGVATIAELIGLRTGVPFGHYHFTDVMGPKAFGLPFFLALAYLGIGYVSWVLALLISGCAGKPIRGIRVLTLPLMAAAIMTAWDVTMDPAWSTLERAWIWHDGGAFFGVPVSNFAGWFLNAMLYYFVFALFCRTQTVPPSHIDRRFWSLPAIMYLICALGNLLLLGWPMAPAVVTDATGRRWVTSHILAALTISSLAIMTPLALVAFSRAKALPVQQHDECIDNRHHE